MFEIPQAKRVRRSELFSASRSASPTGSANSSEDIDPAIELQLQQRLASIYGAIEVDNGSSDVPKKQLGVETAKESADDVKEEGEEAFEFRLFSTVKREVGEGKFTPIQKIVLKDEEVLGDGGFVRTRDASFYIQEKATGDRKRQIDAMAVSGEDILRGTEKRYFGWEVPWRVTVIRTSTKNPDLSLKDQGIQSAVEGKKKKPGKKRRILLRVRTKKKAEMQEKKIAEMEAKEAALKEKKTRRNREKKVKRKLKEKAKKAASTGESGAGNVDVEADGSNLTDRETSPE
ncbi:hypothetical protein F5884DRAFT_86700 [Xylogone sp. PMI_703]|nr:hypothetical protein F5884DRAFT_86700 [Xylogone sp. PMI_703]